MSLVSPALVVGEGFCVVCEDGRWFGEGFCVEGFCIPGTFTFDRLRASVSPALCGVGEAFSSYCY